MRSLTARGAPCGALVWGHVLWLLACLSIASSEAAAQQLPIKAYSTADGLASDSVNRIVRDSSGFLWFCTAGGLSRFDGYAFTTFGTPQGLPHPDVTDFLETRGHEYWVGTRAGLVRFDPSGSPESPAATVGRPSARGPMFAVVEPVDGRRHLAVTVLREGRGGTLWIGTEDGLYALESVGGRRVLRSVEIGIPHEHLEQRIVADVLEDRAGTLWVATPSGLYRRWPDGTAARYGKRDGLPGEFLSSLLEDHEGHLWAGTRLAGFFRFRAGEARALVVDLKLGEAARPWPSPGDPQWVSQIFETSRHRYWLATPKGLVEYLPAGDERGRHFHSYATRNGLTDPSVEAVAEDLNGGLWLGMSNTGAMKLANSGVTTYGERQGLFEAYAIFEDRTKRLCFRASVLGDARTSVFEGARLDLVNGSEPQYYTRFGCFDGERFEWFTLGWAPFVQAQPGMSDADAVVGWVGERVTLQSRNGEWWVGTGQGLYRFPASEAFPALRSSRPLAVYTIADGLAAWQVFRLFEDSHGNIWISTIDSPTTNGLARWEPETQRLRNLANSPGLPSFTEDLARSFGEDRSGTVWIGLNAALVRYANGAFTRFTAAEGLPPGRIQDIHVDQSGRIWLASDQSGLVRVDQSGAARPVFVAYTTAEGLAGNSLKVITEDMDGRLFVGGGSGLDRFDPATHNVKHFSVADGLAPSTFQAAFRDHLGALWFATSQGLTRLAPEPVTSRTAPPIWITGLRGTGLSRVVSAVGERGVSLPDFAPDQRELQIDFVALSFEPGDVLRYQYRLVGAGGDWSVPSEQRSVTYARVAPGRYTFQVRAVNSDGMVSVQPATVTFTVPRPVWLRWWFLVLLACALTTMAYSLYRYRVGRLLELANIRTRIASDLHDDIGANLTRMALLSEGARTDIEATSPDASLTAIARIARESVSSMSDIVWAIKPERESLLDLTRRLRQYADEVFAQRGVELRFNAHGAPEGLRLGVGVRRDLLLIFKEAVNNAVRHSHCSRMEIDLRVDRSTLVLELADNGVGFDPAAESDGYGLTSLRRRALRLGGSLAVRSAPGAGTRIGLTIPI